MVRKRYGDCGKYFYSLLLHGDNEEFKVPRISLLVLEKQLK